MQISASRPISHLIGYLDISSGLFLINAIVEGCTENKVLRNHKESLYPKKTTSILSPEKTRVDNTFRRRLLGDTKHPLRARLDTIQKSVIGSLCLKAGLTLFPSLSPSTIRQHCHRLKAQQEQRQAQSNFIRLDPDEGESGLTVRHPLCVSTF